ncbi:MAG TPA: hypothetical protein VIH36_10430, partial [Casimicrobiaceae bacterium]
PRHRYELRMTASAMAIAAREIAAPAAPYDDADLLRQAADCDCGDRDAQRALYAALVTATRAKLVVSNPRLLRND